MLVGGGSLELQGLHVPFGEVDHRVAVVVGVDKRNHHVLVLPGAVGEGEANGVYEKHTWGSPCVSPHCGIRSPRLNGSQTIFEISYGRCTGERERELENESARCCNSGCSLGNTIPSRRKTPPTVQVVFKSLL